jgi:hypothetical protein
VTGAPLQRVLAALLLLGTLAVFLAGAVHPLLLGTAEEQLKLIADTHHWRLIHLSMLAGTAGVLVGIRGQLFRHQGVAAEHLRIAVPVLTLGLTLNALNMLFMTGAGHTMALLYEGGAAGMPTLYAATHPFALMCSRLGNCLVGIAALLIGWGTWSGGPDPRWVSGLAWLAGAVGLVAAVVGPETSPTILLGVALLSFWQGVVAVRALRTQ